MFLPFEIFEIILSKCWSGAAAHRLNLSMICRRLYVDWQSKGKHAVAYHLDPADMLGRKSILILRYAWSIGATPIVPREFLQLVPLKSISIHFRIIEKQPLELVLRWLLKHTNNASRHRIQCFSSYVTTLAEHGDLENLRWLHAHMSHIFTMDTIRRARNRSEDSGAHVVTRWFDQTLYDLSHETRNHTKTSRQTGEMYVWDIMTWTPDMGAADAITLATVEATNYGAAMMSSAAYLDSPYVYALQRGRKDDTEFDREMWKRYFKS
jgi:hypothetical protein